MTAVIHASEDTNVIEGIDWNAEVKASNKNPYFTGKALNVDMFLERPADGEFIKWQSVVVPENRKGEKVTFIMAAGMGSNLGEGLHELFMNGRKILEIETSYGTTNNWKSELATGKFETKYTDKNNDIFGIFSVTVDPKAIEYGKRQNFEMKGKEGKESSGNGWFSVYKEDDLRSLNVNGLEYQSTMHQWFSAAFFGEPVRSSNDAVTVSSAKFSTGIPFSFVYDGKPSAQFLSSWQRSVEKHDGVAGEERYAITYLDPRTKLQITCEAVVYTNYPAVEWLLRLTNTGSNDTPIIENILPLDMTIIPPGGDIALHSVNDSTASKDDYAPYDRMVDPMDDIILFHHKNWHNPKGCSPYPWDMLIRKTTWGLGAKNHYVAVGGCIPYSSIEWNGGGIVEAIGWTGMWKSRIFRGENQSLNIQTGQERTHLKLNPGETIRTPRILLVTWRGNDRIQGSNALRRLLFAHYVPKINGEISVVPISCCSWFNFMCGTSATESNQLDVINSIPEGTEAFWLDAGWWEGAVSNEWGLGRGNWVPKKDAFPRGLRPLADAAKRRGMKFILWFEPEIVLKDTKIAREHPQWVIGNVFNLGDPAARQWMTDFLSDCIAKWGVDIYRQDRNNAPLNRVWALDTADRQGMAEIRYVEGLYAMWDELLRRHPGLMIDNANWQNTGCDLEMVKRSIGSLTRSECFFNAEYSQMHTATLSQYVPLSANCISRFDPYHVRANATAGVAFTPDPRGKSFPIGQARCAFDEIKMLRPYWSGDFYPLLDRIDVDEHNWCAWQLHRSDLNAGFAVFFRRSQSSFVTADVTLRGLDPKMRYEVTFKETYDIKEKRIMLGTELQQQRIEITSKPGSFLLIYRKAE